jgi:TolB protein
MLVFARGGDLYRMAVDGSETARLTATMAVEGVPAVSPDGFRIAFTRGTKGGADELWVSDSRGLERRKVVPARPRSVKAATTAGPSWSPDGRWIYLARAASGPHDVCGWIYRVGADGRVLRRITKGVELDTDPAPSPDGSRIAFATGDCEPATCGCVLSVVDSRGRPTSDLRRLPSSEQAELGPAWSPDSSRVAFELRNDNGSSALYVADRDGSASRRITRKGLNPSDPAWSSDGEWIAFAAWTRSSGSDLYLVHPDGGGLRRLTTTAADESSPAWVRRS